jgi:hypothetical protein
MASRVVFEISVLPTVSLCDGLLERCILERITSIQENDDFGL